MLSVPSGGTNRTTYIVFPTLRDTSYSLTFGSLSSLGCSATAMIVPTCHFERCCCECEGKAAKRKTRKAITNLCLSTKTSPAPTVSTDALQVRLGHFRHASELAEVIAVRWHRMRGRSRNAVGRRWHF